MQFEALGNPLILIPTGIIVILDFLALPLFIKWLKNGERKRLRYLLFFKPFSTLICIYFMFTQFGSAFFVGAWYLPFALLVALIMLVYLFVQAFTLRKKTGSSKKMYIVHLLTGFAIAFSIAIPPMLYSPIKETCARDNSAKIPAMSQAMNNYFSDHNSYPKTLDELIPTYIDQIPTPSCNLISGAPRTFFANTCKGEVPFFYVRTVDFVGFDFYEYGTGRHWRLHSFLDNPDPGYCR
ncbi:MAG: hypothetical protein K8R77_03130 [Anaerolineaceae bacterium]|nr:hypothetical protein [Anaerolineaceae bacterium]